MQLAQGDQGVLILGSERSGVQDLKCLLHVAKSQGSQSRYFNVLVTHLRRFVRGSIACTFLRFNPQGIAVRSPSLNQNYKRGLPFWTHGGLRGWEKVGLPLET